MIYPASPRDDVLPDDGEAVGAIMVIRAVALVLLAWLLIRALRSR